MNGVTPAMEKCIQKNLYNETSLKQTNVGSPLALCYIEGSTVVS